MKRRYQDVEGGISFPDVGVDPCVPTLKTSLLVLMLVWKMFQLHGCQTVLQSHVLSTYLTSWFSSGDVALGESFSKAGWMSAAGKKGSAIRERMYLYSAPLLVYVVLRPNSCVLRQTAWPKWKAQPLMVEVGNSLRMAFHAPQSIKFLTSQIPTSEI